MGLLLSCDKCTPTGTETVLTFSDSLVERLTVGEGELDTYDQYEEELLEQNYMDRIKCVDHSHSIAYGLTTDSFNSLVKHLERKFTEDHEASEMFTRQEIINCLNRHPECPLNCSPATNAFISKQDAKRLRRAKKYFDELEQQKGNS